MKCTILIPLSVVWLVLIDSSPLQNAAFALANAETFRDGERVPSKAPITCAVINSECEIHNQCCSFYCLNGICTCVAKGRQCTIDTDCCKFKNGAKCKGGKCSA